MPHMIPLSAITADPATPNTKRIEAPYVEEAGHFYNRDGSPAYEIVGKNGVLRATTLRDARILKLVPSVTTISKLAAKPALEFWKEEQRMLAALTLPRRADELDASFCQRIREDAREQAKRAAARGSAIHTAIERHFRGEDPGEYHEVVKAVQERLNEAIGTPLWSATPEKSFAHPLGFGGKLDLVAEYMTKDDVRKAVIDYKCKEFTSAELAAGKKLAWDEHCMQLAAYRKGSPYTEAARCINIFVSRNEPGLVSFHEWREDELYRGWQMFAALLKFWIAKTQYDPGF
jgi:hypothetical protein